MSITLPEREPRAFHEHLVKRYARAMRTLFGITLDEPTRQQWIDVRRLVWNMDDFLDGVTPAEIDERSAEANALLDDEQAIQAQFPHIAPAVIGDQQSVQIITIEKQLVAINRDVKVTGSISEYIRLREVEGLNYCRILSAASTSFVRTQPGYPKFEHLLANAGVGATLFNSFRHIHKDAQRGEISVRPDRMTRLQLIGRMAHTALYVGQSQPIED